MRFKKKNINEILDEVVLYKENGARSKTDEDDTITNSSSTYMYEGLDIGYCGINDTVPGCSC